ncbi:YbaB/EbfC family nucleoid-associated protein [Propionibacteriaceae bacterium Y1685]|uniref:YbaB/EbfC family nucleoid-associated protein n=1 Tax=Microlunatus sp. Y1700 TaxID=3418487 RepID=UPI003B828F09
MTAPSPMGQDPQRIIDDMAARAQQMYAQARRQQEELAALAATSSQGAVTVTVAPGGAIQQISFSGAGSETPPRLTTAFNEAYREAVREVGKATAAHSGGLDAEVLANVPADTDEDGPGRPSHATVEHAETDPDAEYVIPDDPEVEAAFDKLDFDAVSLEAFRNDPLVLSTVPRGAPDTWQQQLTDEIAAISANASSINELMTSTVGEAESKAVRAVVSVNGAVRELAFRSGAGQLTDEKLADDVRATLAEATTQASAALREALSGAGVPTEGSPVLDALDRSGPGL